MRLRRYVSLKKSISIVSFGGTCRVLRAHDTAASSLADDCFAVLGGSATMRLRRYVSLEKSIRIVMVGGTCRVFHAHDIAALSVARDRLRSRAASPPFQSSPRPHIASVWTLGVDALLPLDADCFFGNLFSNPVLLVEVAAYPLARQVDPSLFDPRFLRSFVLPRRLA